MRRGVGRPEAAMGVRMFLPTPLVNIMLPTETGSEREGEGDGGGGWKGEGGKGMGVREGRDGREGEQGKTILFQQGSARSHSLAK